LKKRAISLVEYERGIDKIRKENIRKESGYFSCSDVSLILKQLIVICFMICYSSITTNESVHYMNEMEEAEDKYVRVYYEKYELGNLKHPQYKYKIEPYHIKSSMASIRRWETNNTPFKITDEPKGLKSYGQYCNMSNTAKLMGWDGKDYEDLLSIDGNAKYAIKYYCMQVDRYGGYLEKSMSAFNAGSYRPGKKKFAKNQDYMNAVYPNFVLYNRHFSKTFN